ncbi:hypothetical protein V1520DRAFT_330189 [Lipomyces starkeyi]|uniref:Polynucleotide 5'-hydroxyl-kinase GRC3 n=1 Tax=Lipomyces starkeyi NRRL Y-11557 TaxID=675824 RepID=A0A1E3Q9J6_LIPST|nr:hypothetical protein LIPSTDRAFT_2315 [Lipomyces starkeyi NRRL Y-11557]
MKRSRPQASAKAFISAFAAKKAKQTPEIVPIDVDNPVVAATPTTSTAARTQNPEGDLVGSKTAIAPTHVEAETVIQKGNDEYEIQYASASDSDFDEEDYEILISDSEEERPPNLITKISDVIDLDESVQVSTFAPTGENLLETDSVSLFCFSHGQRLVIKGQYSVRVIKGSISICSAKLTASTEFHKVFAPSTHAIPTIFADGQGKDISKDIVRNELIEMIPFDFTPAVDGFLQFDVIIAIRSLFTGIENLEKICQNLKNVWSSPGGQNTRSYEVLYRVSQSPPVLVTPEEGWETRLRIISQRIRDSTTPDVMKCRSEDFRPRIFICGPKSAGKSTFARLLTNSLITSAGLAPDELPNRSTVELVYMELDPGQPEFGPSGVLSLNVIDSPMLGPSLTNSTLSNSVKAFHFGYTTPRDAPQDYIRCVDKLMSHYNNDLHRFTDDNACQIELPLIVNTPGWTKGQGVEVLRQMIDITKPSIIVYIGPRLVQPDMDTNFELAEVLRTTSPNASLSELAPFGDSGRKSAKYSAADLRVAQTMAYFHSTGLQTWDFCKPLIAWRPYIVRYSNGGDADVHGIEILGYEKILDQHIPAAINGTVVGISAVSADAALKIRSASTGDSSVPILDTPTIDADADAVNCLGLGIIRAIDQATKTLHILTPISPQTIFHAVSSSNKIILSRGRLPLPIWAAWDGDQSGVARRPWREVPYLSVDEIIGADVRAAVGGQSLRFRRNVMRRSQHVRT